MPQHVQKARKIAIINQKGGVGKTTTTANLGAALARAGRRVLLIDMDPQGHLSMHLGAAGDTDVRGTGAPPAEEKHGQDDLATPAEHGQVEDSPRHGECSTWRNARATAGTIYNVLTDGWPLTAAVRASSFPNVNIVPSTIDLAAAEVELVGVVGREALLRDALAEFSREQPAGQATAPDSNAAVPASAAYDYLLLDCPPSLGLLTLNALSAAEEVFICLQPHFLALQGVGKLLETVALVQQRINPSLSVTGVVLCMYDLGTRLAGEVVDDLSRFLAESATRHTAWSSARIFKTIIRRNIKLAECPSFGQVIFEYAPASHGAEDYAGLAEEVLAMESGTGAPPVNSTARMAVPRDTGVPPVSEEHGQDAHATPVEHGQDGHATSVDSQPGGNLDDTQSQAV